MGSVPNAQYFHVWCVRYALSLGAASPTGETMPGALRSVQVPNTQKLHPRIGVFHNLSFRSLADWLIMKKD